MFFSQEDYRKIYDWLKCHSIKDSEFAITDSVDNDDTVVILHNGMNYRVSLSRIISLIPRISINKDLNVLTFEGKSYQLTPYEGSAVVVETIITYGDITLNLSYPKASANGGFMDPIYSYSQNKTITRIYSDGRVVDNTEAITTGAELSWSGYNVTDEGRVYVDSTSSEVERKLGEVTLRASLNGKESSAIADIVQGAKLEPVITTTFSIPSITLSYAKVPVSGGTVSPTFSYSQVKTTTTQYPDGTSETTTETITSGASVLFTTTAGTINANTGALTIGSTTSTTEKDVASVTAKVTMNGKEGTETVSVKQLPVVTNWYMGQVDGTKTTFPSLSVNDLKAYADAVPVTTKSKTATINHTIWYVMIPSNISVNSSVFISGGFENKATKEEIENRTIWAIPHDNVQIDGKEYVVYAYRNTAFATTPVSGTFKIN